FRGPIPIQCEPEDKTNEPKGTEAFEINPLRPSLFSPPPPFLSSPNPPPAVRAKALDNSEITLPNPDSQQVLILMVGFSHKSGDLCKVWGRKISADFHADARIAYFTIPVLQSAPSLVRPMIAHGMRKDVPA